MNLEWDFRMNGYVPTDMDPQLVPGTSASAIFTGNNIVVRSNQESAFGGLDGEIGRLLWSNDPCCCEDDGSWVSSLDAELRAFAGGYYFDNSNNAFEEISGLRARTELRLYDLAMLGEGSRLTLDGLIQHDDVRGTQTEVGLYVRVPYGPSPGRRLSRMQRRMVDRIVRDVDVVASNQAIDEAAKFALTGQPISQAITIDRNTVNPEGVIEGAGADSLVIAEGSAGIIIPAGTVDMDIGQVVLGGGSGVTVVGCNTGAMANFIAPGTRPTINNSFAINSGGGLIGLDINGQGTTAAVNLIGAGDFEISHSNITNVDKRYC